MRRRSLLSVLGVGAAGLAGCSTDGGDGGDGGSGPATTRPPATDAGDPTATEGAIGTGTTKTPAVGSDDGERRTVAVLETGPRTVAVPTYLDPRLDLRVTVEVVATATADHPATIQLTVGNRGEYPEVVRARDVPLLSDSGLRLRYADADGDLYVVPAADHRFAADVPRVARGPEGYWQLGAHGKTIADETTLEADETVTGEFWIVCGPDHLGMTPGRYGRHDGPQFAVWNTDRPGPAGDSVHAGVDVPPLPHGTVDWYHDAGPESATFVRPDRERASLPAGLGFTFRNHSLQRAECGGWSLRKLHDGAWYHLAPYYTTDVCRVLPPGAIDTWRLVASNGPPIDASEPATGRSDVRSLGHLGGGRYAFVANYSTRDADLAGHAAVVDLDGPAVTVTPREVVTAERNGSAVTVTTPTWGDDEHPPDARLVLSPAEDADRTVLTEQVLRPPLDTLRDVLPFVEPDVNEVVLRTDEHAVQDVVGHDSSSVRFRYRGQAYRTVAERLGEES